MNEMIYLGATDVHFIPLKDHYRILYRLDGKLLKWKELRMNVAIRLLSHFKYRSGMNIGEKRKPQSSAMLHHTNTSTYSLRLSTLPTHEKESLAIRLLPHSAPRSLQSIPLLSQTQQILMNISKLEEGLCLFSGPTGSGKSTTMYAIVEQLLTNREKTVITIEDPIERPLPAVVQVEVNPKAGMTFGEILRASLRHDPDVLLIGEIRDEQTATLAIRAGLTGHLVLATIHAGTSRAALLRMLDLGVSRTDLSACLRFVLSQKLLRKMCSFCRGECMPFCRRRSGRAALFDVLTGNELYEAIYTPNSNESSFVHAVKKAWALGYVTDEEIKRIAYEA